MKRQYYRQVSLLLAAGMLAASHVHASFFDGMNDALNKVQQTVNSTTQTVEGARQTIESTKNSAQQTQQIPQQVQQVPAQVNQYSAQPYSQPQSQVVPSQGGAAIDETALRACKQEVARDYQQVMAEVQIKDRPRAYQISHTLQDFAAQRMSEHQQLAQKYAQPLQQNPAYYQPQYIAEAYASSMRECERSRQYLHDVKAGRINFAAGRPSR